MLPYQPNNSVIESIRLLQELAGSPHPLGVRELGRSLEMDPTRVNRLLKTMAHTGIVLQDSKRKYTCGPAMHVLSAQTLFVSGFIRRAISTLDKLGDLGLIIALGTLWRDQVSYVYHALPRMTASEAMGRIGLAPATRSAIGMELLAQQSDKEVRSLYQGKDIPGYPGGIRSLLRDLKIVRSHGYARIVFETQPLAVSLAIPIGSPCLWAIALSGAIVEKDTGRMLDRLRQASVVIDSVEG